MASKNQVFFIDTRNLGHLINRRTLEFSDDDIAKASVTCSKWRADENGNADMQGFCKNVSAEKAKSMNYVLTPGRFVGLPD